MCDIRVTARPSLSANVVSGFRDLGPRNASSNTQAYRVQKSKSQPAIRPQNCDLRALRGKSHLCTYDIKISQITKLKGTKSHKARHSFLVAHPGASKAPPAHLPLHTRPHAVAPWADVADPFRQRHRARPCDTGHSGLRTRTLEFGFGLGGSRRCEKMAPGPVPYSGTGAPPFM